MKEKQLPLILASSSSYRKQQLQSLGLSFSTNNPNINEVALVNELPAAFSVRLATEKAQKVKAEFPNACVIGSDQVCAFNGQVFGKPGIDANAIKQLQTFSGNRIEFFTALCVMTGSGQSQLHTDLTVVKFRDLTTEEIVRYIEKEQPLHCAGSFKVESLGLSLFESVESTDPSALMGLPLIKLCQFLRLIGFKVP